MILGKKLALPPRAKIEDALSDARVLWRDGEALAIVDVTTGATVARRDVPGLVWARLRQYPVDARIPREHGSALEICTSAGTLLGRPDLSGELRPWPFPKEAPDARIGDVAIYTVFEMFERGVLLHVETGEKLARAPEGVHFQAADPESGLFFGVARDDESRDTCVVAVRVTDGGVAWKTTVFAVKVDDRGSWSTAAPSSPARPDEGRSSRCASTRGPAPCSRSEAPRERPAGAPPLAARARERGIDLPAAVTCFFEARDRDETLRDALASLGFHVEAWALHEDDLATLSEEMPDIVPEGFFPLWGDDYHAGGLLPDGGFAVVDLEDVEVRRFASLGAAVRALVAYESRDATVELVLEALERAGA